MPVRTIVDRVIESSTHGNGGILLNGTDGSSSNAGSFLVLDASAASTVDVNERIEYEQETIAEENIEKQTIVDFKTNFDAIELENEDGFLLLDSSASGVDVEDRVVYDAIFVDKLNLFNINSFGSSSQVLQVNSGANAFEFANSSQAFATLLTTQTVNNASNTFYVQFNNLNTTYGSTYNTLRIVFRDFRPETANRELNIRVSATAGALDNGSSDYAYSAQSIRQGAEDYTGSASHTSIKISGHGIGDGSGNAAGYGVIDINGYNDSSYYAMMTWRCHFDGGNATTSLLHIIGEGYRKTTSALENVAIGVNNFADNPGIHNGIFKLYGLNT